MKNNNDIFIYGGTFCPPHIGHYLAIQYILAAYQPYKLIIVPAVKNPTKDDAYIDNFEERAKLLSLMINNDISNNFSTKIIDGHNIEKSVINSGKTEKKDCVYTYELIDYLVDNNFEKNCKFHFVKGEDVLISSFREYGFIIDKPCEFVTIPRFSNFSGTSIRERILSLGTKSCRRFLTPSVYDTLVSDETLLKKICMSA